MTIELQNILTAQRHARMKAAARRRRRTCVILLLTVIGTIFIAWMIGAAMHTTTTPVNTAYAEPPTLSDEATANPANPDETAPADKPKAESTQPIVQSALFTPADCALSVELQEYTYYLCEAYNVDFAYAMGLMETESSFKANTISKTNDYGLMQINIINHATLSETLGITDFLDPYQNIRAGLHMLSELFEKYGDPEKVAMAYNMGEHGAAVLWSHGVTHTDYSDKVLMNSRKYH